MILSNSHLLFYSANFLIIITSLIAALLYFCNIHQLTPEEDDRYFPARKMIGIANLFQLLQIPYLLNTNSESVFFYVLTVDLVIYLPFCSIIWEKYLYGKNPGLRSVVGRLSLPILLILSMGSDLAMGGNFFISHRKTVNYLTLLLVFMEMIQFVRTIRNAHGNEMALFRQNYSSEGRFPTTFALRSAVPMFLRLMLILTSYLAANQWMKMGKDLFFSLIAVYVLTFLTKKVRQNGFAANLLRPEPSQDEEIPIVDIPDLPQEEDALVLLLGEIKNAIEEHELFRNPEFKLTDLLQYVNSNRTYVSLAINRETNMNFYQLIQSYRLSYSKKLLANSLEMRISEISDESGFSSPKIFSRVFKQEMSMTPTEYRKLHEEKASSTSENGVVYVN